MGAALSGGACASEEPSEPPPLRAGELSAEAFLDSVGVAVHFNYTGTTYERQSELLERLTELGVRHVRDAMPVEDVPLAAGLRAARRAGIRATLTTGDVTREPLEAVRDSLKIVGRKGIEAFEGPNELDNSEGANWPAVLRRYMPALAAAVDREAPNIPLIGPSFVHPDSRERLPGDLPGQLNGHPYPGGQAPEPALGAELDRMPADALARGIVFTETGYHNALQAGSEHPPASEDAAAAYLPRLLLAAFGAGVRRTFIYELADVEPEAALADPVQHFGLLRSDLSPKPAFEAVRTLIRAVRTSPGRGSPDQSRWRLEGEGKADIQRLTLVRDDQSRLIAVWRAVSVWDRDARQPLRVDVRRLEVVLPPGARDVTVWRPSVSTHPVLRRGAIERLELRLGGDVVLISLR